MGFIGRRRLGGSGRCDTFPSSEIVAPGTSVVLCRKGIRLETSFPLSPGVLEIPLEEWNAPAATGAGSSTLRQLAGNPRLVHAQVIENLTLRDVKAQAEFVIKLHSRIDSGQGASDRPGPAILCNWMASPCTWYVS
jgi:hypothetical protein